LAIVVSIAEYQLRVIELDGFPIKEKVVDQLMLSPGETAQIIPKRKLSDTRTWTWIEVVEAGVLIGAGELERPLDRKKAKAQIIINSNDVVDNSLGVPLKFHWSKNRNLGNAKNLIKNNILVKQTLFV